MINYNFNNVRQFTEDEILTYISQEEIYSYYMRQNFKINNLYKCYFHDDNNPSMGFFESKNYIIHNCFSCGSSGNVINFVMKMLNINYYEALEQITKDFNIRSQTNIKSILNNNYSKSSSNNVGPSYKTIIHPTIKGFNKIDYDYWNSYYLELDYIINWEVNACSVVYYTSKSGDYKQYGVYQNNNPMYCYKIDDSYKIYRPLNPNKRGKWFQNCTMDNIQGMNQLSKHRDILIITSSLKDVMVLRKLGYEAIAPHGESTSIPDYIIDYLWATSDNIIVFYDNDKIGHKFSNILSNKIGAGNIHIPDNYNEKDISDFVKLYGIREGKELMNSLI